MDDKLIRRLLSERELAIIRKRRVELDGCKETIRTLPC